MGEESKQDSQFKWREVIVGKYRGKDLSDIDAEIGQRRISSACFVIPHKYYNRRDGKFYSSEKCYVIDYQDGEYENFVRENSDEE